MHFLIWSVSSTHAHKYVFIHRKNNMIGSNFSRTKIFCDKMHGPNAKPKEKHILQLEEHSLNNL